MKTIHDEDAVDMLRMVRECETAGRSFASVRRENGDDVYRAVRDECVRRGRGQIELRVVAENDRGGIVCEVD
jgi:hypothetical protein